eukprot:15276182-Ditylum_brightwellii.AAC.1
MMAQVSAFSTCSPFGRLRSSELQSPSRLMSIVEQGIDISHLPSSSTPEDRALKAKQVWTTTALQTVENRNDIISLQNADNTRVYNQNLFDQFLKVQGTYFMNGLSSCQIGDRLIHPFEAHGNCKSLVFDGEGQLHYTSRIIETPLTANEQKQNKILNRGVMSTVASMDSVWGKIQNAMSSQDRDTANLVANLWPIPKENGSNNSIEPVLIT